jgi:hypothetical protein
MGEPSNALPKSLDHEHETPRKKTKTSAILNKARFFETRVKERKYESITTHTTQTTHQITTLHRILQLTLTLTLNPFPP